ncbi:MAG: hypothetical protein FJ088_10105, partial [Deltaproteobacteria bacterium]|nr:hypothetical protein [Deltaproteobacteria bacterium]
MKRFFVGALFLSVLTAGNGAYSQEKQPEGGEVKGGKFTLERYETIMDEKIAEKQKEISKIRQENIKKMLELLKKPYYENKAEVYFRLAEAYWQEIFYNSLLARTEYEKKMDEFEAGRLSDKPEEPKEDYTISLDYYRKVLQEFPDYGRIDEVMYYLGKGALR